MIKEVRCGGVRIETKIQRDGNNQNASQIHDFDHEDIAVLTTMYIEW